MNQVDEKIAGARTDLVEALEHLDGALALLTRARGTLDSDAEARLQDSLKTLYEQRSQIVGALNEIDQALGAPQASNVQSFGPRRLAD